ncbi:MAG TPA: threonine/serine dehydratase [Geminicoccus sp.]|jgi:threonine dehydratase|uniref:threonine ammonia-lyase n=1 Tax=Geminicoccus sp. TaxID=2024832 RepID=UPI002E37134E|nr:threonine/serine dehydratase [Geminicoccus sp.]HEX2528040.1 threonine/serine dehydratase [Geminicoccus sp.]
MLIDIEDVRAAAARLKDKVRRTPMVIADQLLETPAEAALWMKLECLQVTGSFKARGATNRLLQTPPEKLKNGIVTASGGNHGLAVARAGRLAGVRTTVFLPGNSSPAKRAKIAAWGADARVVGDQWDQSNIAAHKFAEETGGTYFHPFADKDVVAGQGTVALEVLEEHPDTNVFLIAIGGGGLISGMSTAIRAIKPDARIIGIEPTGSPTLQASLAAGEVVTLPKVTTSIPTMGCGRTSEGIYQIVAKHVDEVVLLEDQEMADAAKWLWFEFGLATDSSGAAAAAALRMGKVKVSRSDKVCVLVCGSGTDGLV